MNDFFTPLSHFHFIALTGQKAADFLQGQITCDVREINPTQTRRGAHCSAKGRVLATFRVLQFAEQLYLMAPESMTDAIIQQLKKYAVLSKVSLQHDQTLQAIGCVGENLASTLEKLLGKLPETPDQAIFRTPDLMLIRVQGALPRFEIIGTTAAIHNLQANLSEKYLLQDDKQWHLLDIQASIPTIYPQTRDLFTPHMLNYPALQGVSFKKGCYIGQEVIARTHYLGKAKRHLQLLNLQSKDAPEPADTIQAENGNIVGSVIDSERVEGHYQLLAVLQDDSASGKLFINGYEVNFQ